MAHTYTVNLSDSEQIAMEYVAADVNEWIQNVVHERARIASEQMVSEYINERLVTGESISGTKEEIVMKSNLPNAQARHEENLKKMPPIEPV